MQNAAFAYVRRLVLVYENSVLTVNDKSYEVDNPSDKVTDTRERADDSYNEREYVSRLNVADKTVNTADYNAENELKNYS